MPTIGEIYNRKFAKVSKAQTLSGSNTTVATPLFRISGVVLITQIYGEVTTAMGSNVTAAAYRLNDQTAQVDITLSTGTVISSVAAGSAIVKKGVAGSAIALQNNSAGRVSEPTTLETLYFSPFVATKKTAANTDIEFVYATTNTPTTGAITHYVEYEALSADGAVTPL
jgi:hypothetical protein